MKVKGINRNHKDRLFCFIFGSEEHKEWALALYNAVNGTAYNDEDKIEITTISDVLYMGMKNDVSFILHDTMNLYEQQSSYNPNMPVRELMYVGKLYDKYIRQNKLNIYGRKQIYLPVPKCVVFYNGKEEKEDGILRLSDAFSVNDKEADIAVSVRVININKGHNLGLMASCKPLSEYAWLIQSIREYSMTMEIGEAVDAAMDNMPEDYEIRSFLEENRSEVKNMCLTEYDEDEVMTMFKEEGREEGIKEGLVSAIHSIMESFKVSASEAMDILKISAEDRQEYMSML